ncbi:mitochondrial import inner membrane translocase subunit [Grosmannia clavigera kw1407]|uniref:Mitochondrial import inner membrane translocase subunit n=1 Tax=Grosmannia clavigera (strain kw1407 / UAMH 11150) TaxID=655863 RepID=F0XC60_GROCL|nr:mitochondrial import inner membrane translocase subunit [Grosmannia clavigera kw1407]EFX04734.1 mitochondrial import inner membrane translocase subunit [Grosmannia clavigera kw1407]
MSIWDALTGRKSPAPHSTGSSTAPPGMDEAASPSPSPSPSPSSLSTDFHSPQHSVFSSPTLSSPGSGGGAEVFLQSSAFADPTQLHPLAGLNRETLEYITMEDSALSDLPGSQSALPSRGFTDDLCYGTGITYLAALSLGGAWGLQEGLRRSAGQPPKLRLNSVLNAVTRRGPFLGNSAGVVAIVYNCTNSYIGYLRGRHDAANSVLAGALSGIVFKSTRGVRPMLISGGIVASVAAAWAMLGVMTIRHLAGEIAPVGTAGKCTKHNKQGGNLGL